MKNQKLNTQTYKSKNNGTEKVFKFFIFIFSFWSLVFNFNVFRVNPWQVL